MDDVLHDVLALAENECLATVDVTQLDSNGKPLHAVRYTINANGTISSGDRAGQWRRKISDKHRLVYEIHDQVVEVLVLSSWGHYDDK